MIEKKRLPIPREDVMAWYADEAHHRMWGEADHCYAYRMYLLGKLDAKQAAQQQAEPLDIKPQPLGAEFDKVLHDNLSSLYIEDGKQQAEPGADERAAWDAFLAAKNYPGQWREQNAFYAGYRAAQSGQRAGVAPEYVMVQRRMRPTWRPEGEGWTDWEECSEATARDCEQVPILHGWQHEVRWLCVAAAPTQQQEGK